MTIVVARRRATRIDILADTMISSTRGGKPDRIPGCLKILILSDKLSIAYAGTPEIAVEAIRFFRDQIAVGVSIDTMLEYLRAVSEDRDNDVHFLIASHLSECLLCKVSNGNMTIHNDLTWIGDADAANDIYRNQNYEITLSDGSVVDNFAGIFTSTFLMNSAYSSSVGGLPVHLVATDNCHRYNWYAGKTGEGSQSIPSGVWTPIFAGPDVFTYYSVPSEYGVSVFGFYLENQNVGYLYTPLASDYSGTKFQMISMDDMVIVVNEAARCALHSQALSSRA